MSGGAGKNRGEGRTHAAAPSRSAERLCQRAEALACDALLDPLTPDLPDHVCWTVPEASLRRNGNRITVGPPFALQEPRRWLWPLGAHEPGSTWAPLALWAVPGGQPIGLIVVRDFDKGTAILLGHVLPADYEPTRGGQTFTGRPVRGALLGPFWTFVEPTLHITWLQGASPAQVQQVESRGLDLARWYRKVLVGRRLRPRGRPIGSGEYAREDLVPRLAEAVAAVREDGRRVTQLNVAERLSWDERSLRRALRHHGIRWHDVRTGLDRSADES